MKIMKGIARIGRRLISVLLVLLVSSLMFLTSPAIALSSNTVTLDWDNFETEVLNSDKTVVVLLISDESPEDLKAKLKSEVEKTYGDKYKIAIGSVEENRNIYSLIPAPAVYPPLPAITAFKNGQPLRGIPINPNDPTLAVEFLNKQIADS